MKRLLFLAALLAATAACEMMTAEENHKKKPDEVIIGEGEYLDCDPGIYVTAVTFDDGYDWQRDTAIGAIKGRIEVYKKDVLILSIPAGPEHEVSLDADKHHFIEGHLYTEYTTLSETVIKKDGNDFIRYEGTESLKGIVIRDEDFYTLGQKTGGKGGFSLRKNGNPLMEKDNGVVWGSMADPAYADTGALYEDDGIMYFAYYSSHRDDAFPVERRWYLVKNQTVIEVWLEREVSDFYDLRMIHGQLCKLYSRSDEGGPILEVDDHPYNLSNTISYRLSDDYRLLMYKNRPYFFGTFRYKQNPPVCHTGVWNAGERYNAYKGKLMGIYVYGETFVMVLRLDNGKLQLNYSFYNYGVDIPGNMLVSSPQCAAISDRVIYIALNGASAKEKPVLWTIGESYTYEINGFLTGVSVIK